jgi:hypothetical protein
MGLFMGCRVCSSCGGTSTTLWRIQRGVFESSHAQREETNRDVRLLGNAGLSAQDKGHKADQDCRLYASSFP